MITALSTDYGERTWRSSKLRKYNNRILFTKLAVCGALWFFTATSFGEQGDTKPVLDASLTALLLAFDASKLTGDNRRTFDVLTLIIEDVDKANTGSERDGFLQEFLVKSQDFVREHPNSIQLWTLRAVAAMELNQPNAGREACQRMIGLRAGDLDDPKIRRVLAMLDRKGWFNTKAADESVTVDSNKPRARPVLDQPHTRPAVFEDNPMGTSNIGPVAYSAKWSRYGEYLHKMMEKIQIQWDRILIGSKTQSPSGTYVTVKFTMDLHGKITEIAEVESNSSEQGKQSCLTAITMTAPYGDWTDEMIAVLGTSQELTFRFYYE
jgi:hypothetical protein